MAKYGNFLYGAGKYGNAPKLAYSVEPMESVVLDFTRVFVSWASPTGTFSRIRLVRNQVGYSEHAEDGVIIWDEFASEGTVTRSSFTDGEDNPTDIPLIPGKPVYYTMFLFTDERVWLTAGNIADAMPSDHDVQRRLIDTIPKVFTSSEQSPLGVTDTESPLYYFLDGFAFTFEQLLTLIDLIRPNHTKEGSPSSIIAVQTDTVGLNAEQNIPLKNQKQLIREAFYMYAHKGVLSGILTYAESLTGYPPEIQLSENLLLTVQDSTFYGSTGNWVFVDATAEESNEQVPASGDNVIDSVYTCKVTATDPFTMSLGMDTPITKGVPVLEETEYTTSFKIKSPPSDGNVTLTITWYDGNGEIIDTSVSSSTAANNTWKTVSLTETSPVSAVYAGLEISSSADGQYYVDQVCMQLGDTVSYDEARAINVHLHPNKTNYINNPSFEANVTDSWTLGGDATAAQDADVSELAYSGGNSAKITATGDWSFTSNAIPITVGQYYTASGFFKSTDDMQINFIGRDINGDVVENTDIYPILESADWSRFTATDLTDATNTEIVTYELEFSGGAGTYYLDCLQFERGSSATEYFDGSLPSEFGTIWEGTEDNSYSDQYYNKLFKIPRLGYTLSEWTPPNAFWRITSNAGVEYTNLTV